MIFVVSHNNRVVQTWEKIRLLLFDRRTLTDGAKENSLKIRQHMGQGGHLPPPPGPVEPDKSSLRKKLFSLDSVI